MVAELGLEQIQNLYQRSGGNFGKNNLVIKVFHYIQRTRKHFFLQIYFRLQRSNFLFFLFALTNFFSSCENCQCGQNFSFLIFFCLGKEFFSSFFLSRKRNLFFIFFCVEKEFFSALIFVQENNSFLHFLEKRKFFKLQLIECTFVFLNLKLKICSIMFT